MAKIAGYKIGHDLVGYEPLNTSLAYAIGKQDSIVKHWWAKEFKTNNLKILTIEAKRLKPHLFYYATVKNYYELFGPQGPYYTAYTKDEYLARRDRNEFLTLVHDKKNMLFACFHSGLSHAELLKMARDVSNERDAQRSKLYGWHWKFIKHFPHLNKTLSSDVAQGTVLTILKDYSFDLDRVDFAPWSPRNKKAVANHTTIYESKLDPANFCQLYYRFNNTTLATVLHEVGHSLTNTEYSGWAGNYVAAHGPEYCLIFAELLARYAGLDFSLVYDSMLNAKLKIAPRQDYFDGKEYVGYDSL